MRGAVAITVWAHWLMVQVMGFGAGVDEFVSTSLVILNTSSIPNYTPPENSSSCHHNPRHHGHHSQIQKPAKLAQ